MQKFVIIRSIFFSETSPEPIETRTEPINLQFCTHLEYMSSYHSSVDVFIYFNILRYDQFAIKCF